MLLYAITLSCSNTEPVQLSKQVQLVIQREYNLLVCNQCRKSILERAATFSSHTCTVNDGYNCVSCNQYRKLLRHIKDHSKKVHRDDRAVPCKVQTVISTSCRKYFGVVFGLVTGSSQDDVCTSDIYSVMKETTKGELHTARDHEALKPLLCSGWYPEPDSVDKYDTVNKQQREEAKT